MYRSVRSWCVPSVGLPKWSLIWLRIEWRQEKVRDNPFLSSKKATFGSTSLLWPCSFLPSLLALPSPHPYPSHSCVDYSGPQIGQGQFSKVYIGKYFGDHVAIKKQIRQDKGLDCYLLRELAVLKNAIHVNLVSYFGACNEVATTQSKLNALYIVTEFCQVTLTTINSIVSMSHLPLTVPVSSREVTYLSYWKLNIHWVGNFEWRLLWILPMLWNIFTVWI